MTAKSGFRGSEMAASDSSLGLLRDATTRLQNSDAPKLDARWILAHVLRLDHRDARLRTDLPLTASQVDEFEQLTLRRASGEPLAYILGEWEFFGYRLEVTPAVLVPRPETELLVEWGLELLKDVPDPRIIEVGVGSGAVVIALANQRADLRAVAIDLSPRAIEVARRNLQAHQLLDRVELIEGNLLEPVTGDHHMVISNPPYIVAGDPLLAADVACHQPESALIDDLDQDGLGYHRALIDGFERCVGRSGSLLMECGQGQDSGIVKYAIQSGYQASSRPDLAGIQRAVHIESL